MLKKIMLVFISCIFTFSANVYANEELPGKGITVKPARATWNTGFFQEALVRKALEALGYKVESPKTLQNAIFFQSVTLGDIDYWTNGWFPNQESQLPKDFDEKAELIGYIVKAGGLQGYMVSKDVFDKYGIKTLADFKREDVKKAFGKNKDEKVDLIACEKGWQCAEIVAHHLKVYGLEEHINPLTGTYEAGIASALGAFKSGEPILFYNWAPNWTIYKLKPGKDVMWINVPKIIPHESQKMAVDRMTVAGVAGTVSDPAKLGFIISDIRIVANKRFLEKNPAIKKFFQIFKLHLNDISAQNTKMNDGEKSEADISRHADEWIKANQETWNGWIKDALAAAK